MNYLRSPNRPVRIALAAVLSTALITTTACKQEEDDSTEDLLPIVALAAAFSPQNPGSCSFTFGSRTVPVQEYDVAANGNSSFPNGFTTLFKSWAAIKLPAVANGTTVTFNYAPFYEVGGRSFYLVYNESACPITNSSNADLNYTFPDLASTRTPTNYTVSGNVFTFNATAAGKDFVIISGASASGAGSTVTRNM